MGAFAMKRCIAILLLSCIASTAFGDIDDYEDAVERGNEFVDKLLKDIVEEHGDEYDPYVIDDSVIGFHKKIVVNISGEAKLHDGFIRGLKSLHRADNCYLNENGDRLKVRADMGAGVLDLHYAGSVKFMNYGPTIEVHGTVPYIEIIMEMTVNAKDGKGGKLEKFYIEDIRGMKVWITGLGPLNWAVNTLISGVTTVFRRFIYRAVENKIESHISKRISNYQFPVDKVVTESTVATTIGPTTPEDTTTEEEVTEGPTTPEETTTEEVTEQPTTPEETTTEEVTEQPTTPEETTTEEEVTEEPTTTQEETPETEPPIEEETEASQETVNEEEDLEFFL